MKIEAYNHPYRDERVYTITIDGSDYMRARLDRWDRALIRECSASTSIADALLALQTIAFRLEQPEASS